MNYWTWLENGGSDRVVEDSGKELPPGVTLEEHRKTCEAGERECPYEVGRDDVDDVGDAPDEEIDEKYWLGEKQKQMGRIYNKEGASDRLASLATEVFEGICKGTEDPIRLPAEVFKDEGIEKLPKWMIQAFLVGSAFSDDQDKSREVLEAFAKKNNAYKDDIDGWFDETYGKGKFLKNGMEASVYRESADEVVKNSTLSLGTQDPLCQIERIMLGNRYFPETGYTPIAIGKKKNGELGFALRQKFIPFGKRVGQKKMSDKEIDEWMKQRGWEVADAFLHHYKSKDGNLVCMDVHGDNLVRTKDGNVVCLDSCVLPNAHELYMDGHYDYDKPPQTFLSRK